MKKLILSLTILALTGHISADLIKVHNETNNNIYVGKYDIISRAPSGQLIPQDTATLKSQVVEILPKEASRIGYNPESRANQYLIYSKDSNVISPEIQHYQLKNLSKTAIAGTFMSYLRAIFRDTKNLYIKETRGKLEGYFK